jgi:hypothetical protein
MAKTGFEVFGTHWFLVIDLAMGFIFLLISDQLFASRPLERTEIHGCAFLKSSSKLESFFLITSSMQQDKLNQ